MGGDKKPSAEFFQSGHGKTVLAEAFLSDEQIRRVLRTTAEDLEALSWAGTHGAVASGMQSVAFTPASADRRGLRRDRPGSRHGRHELDGARHRPARRGRAAGDDPLRRARGRHRRRRHDAAVGARLARVDRLRRHRQGLPLRADRRGRRALRSRSAPRRRWPLPAARTSSRRTTSGGGDCGDRARLPLRRARRRGVRARLRARTASGRSSSAAGAATSAPSSCATSRSRSATSWSTAGSRSRRTTRFVAEHQAEYLRRSDESRFYYLQELRFGAFENVWADDA